MNWMPNSNKLYYTVMGEEQNDLVVFDPATMREEVLLKNVPEGYFSWSPTEDYLIICSRTRAKGEWPVETSLASGRPYPQFS